VSKRFNKQSPVVFTLDVRIEDGPLYNVLGYTTEEPSLQEPKFTARTGKLRTYFINGDLFRSGTCRAEMLKSWMSHFYSLIEIADSPTTLSPLRLAGISRCGPLLWLRHGAVILTATSTTQTPNNSTTVHKHSYGYSSRRSGEGCASPVSNTLEEGSAGYGDGHQNSMTDLPPSLADRQILTGNNIPHHDDNPINETHRPNSYQNTPMANYPGYRSPPQDPAQNTLNQHPNKKQKGRKTRANVKVASLNMRGRWHNGANKWPHINQIVKEQKIGILALQETHLTKEDEDALNSSPGFRIHVISSIDPAHTNAKGVAIVINKKLLGTSGIKTHTLVPGRAILTIIPWQKESTLKVLAIYTPNDSLTNQQFWELTQSKLRNLPRPDLLLGDFNVVEDPLDRLPPKTDPFGPISSLHELKSHLRMKDGWRYENPDTLAYTFAQSASQGGSQSRIDRIYISDKILPFSKEWDISPPGIHTDHQIVSARISSKKMPYVGSGCWSLPLYVLKDEKLGEKVIDLGKTLQNEINKSKN